MSIHKKNKKNHINKHCKKPRRSKKNTKSNRRHEINVTPYEIILIWLETKYEISEMEFLFGSNDFVRQARIVIAREYISQSSCEHALLTNGDLEEAFTKAAINAYVKALGLDESVYEDAATDGFKRSFIKRAMEYLYEGVGVQQTDTDISKLAKETLDSLEFNDLRRGTVEQRNAKRGFILQSILNNLFSVDDKKPISHLAQELGIHRETMSKYYQMVVTMLRLGLEITPNIFNEKKRGRKPNPFLHISQSAFDALLVALETTPDEYNLEYSSWSGLAVQEFFEKCCNIIVTLDYVYHFLHAHSIVSKSASRKNPKANPDEIFQFKSELFRKFLEAIRNGEMIVFLDETHIHQGSRHRGYAVKGKEAFYCNNCSLMHCTGSLVTLIGFNFIRIFKVYGTVKGNTLVEIYETQLSSYPSKKFVVFQDNAKIHRAKVLTTWLKTTGSDQFIRFEWLPRYSPDLNPVELFNNCFKEYIKKTLCNTQTEVMNAASAYMSTYQTADGMSTKNGRSKARQFFKGRHTHFIHDTFSAAMRSYTAEKRIAKLNNTLN